MGAMTLSTHVRVLCVSSALIATVACPAMAQSAGDIQELTFGGRDPAQVAAKVASSVVQVVATVYGTTPGSGLLNMQRVVGAGAIVDEAGYILTSSAMVADAMQVEVILAGDTVAGAERASRAPRVLPATIVGIVADLDLAVLRVEATGLPALPLARTRLREGDPTWTVGPLTGTGAAPIAMGVVIATGAPVRQGSSVPYLVTDAPQAIAGAPVVNAAGEIVGLAAAFVDEPAATSSATMALPAALLDAALTQVRSPREWRRGVVGLAARSVGRTGDAGYSSVDLVVSRVTPGLPAARAGIRSGDVLVAVNRQPVDGMELVTLYLALYTLREGQPLVLAVERDGSIMEVSPTAVAVPDVVVAQ